MSSRIVVIGAGTAGARLAQQLRAAGGAEVTLFGEERHAPYNRVLLAEVLAGRYGPELTALPTPGPVRQARVARIDRSAHLVHCTDGTRTRYDTLVLATGSNPVLPPLRGLGSGPGGPPAEDLPDGVHPFRTLDDCLALSAAVRAGTRTVVIGGGLLGVSAARALAERGAQVVLAQQGERLMERQLDAAAGDLVAGHLAARGVEVHTECRVRGLRTTPTGPRGSAGGHRRVSGVELADGFVLDAELVVLACGVRPRTGLAAAAGLEVRHGIVVDDALRTGDPYIRAIGDCAEHAGRVYGLATPAVEQADALAESLTGRGPGRYTGTRALTRLTLTGTAATAVGPLDLAAFGESEAAPGDDVVHLTDATRGTYRKVLVRDDRLIGGVLLGELSAVDTLARAWDAGEPLTDAPLLHLLTHDGGS
ncbi:NAD(P)/FAD-dependent oxidoreductase [Streptomyces triticagri]|uniref:NAD(P)/FAD-dependent oxidoreductase n=1 Tax=Streptomyces triticagri TaxID=2293568 RepID=A0A372M2K3_9ACTN|nr:FAD-dependent oxidoreductase [Streptomyces triticagri]RFU85121.1 NAD(P)/FAD-dependent oxidoreductase [Streptomyces triticagri]